MKKLVLSLCLMALAAPAAAGTKACNATLVAQGVCRVNSNVLLYFDAPAAFWTSLATQICATQGYQATLPNGDPNPQTCNQFAQVWLKGVLMNVEKSGRAVAAGNVAREAVLAEPNPDVGGD